MPIHAFKRSDFPECCGATILADFTRAGTDDEPGSNLKKFADGHVYIAILASYQLEKYQKPLESFGFRLVSDNTVNINSGHRLYIYLRDPVTPKSVVQEKRFF